MKYIIEVNNYENCIELSYEHDSIIRCQHTEYGETVIRANRNGLITLAKILLTLAQENVPAGSHVHLDEDNFLEDDSSELVCVRCDNFEKNQEISQINA